jgi:peptidoglycan/LPS O-acetylase OafA/YrhL
MHRRIPTASPWLLAGFAVVLVLVATATHYGFERPMRRWLRARGERVEVPASASAAA